MMKAVLLVDENDRRRAEVYAELKSRAVPVLQVKDAFDAMATLGRAEFGAVVLGDNRRRLSLRGLSHLARRRHPNIRLLVLVPPQVEARTVEAEFGLPVDVLSSELPPGGIAAHAVALMARPLDPFATQPSSDVVDRAIADAFAEAEQEQAPGPRRAPAPLPVETEKREQAPTPTRAPAPLPVETEERADTLPDAMSESAPQWDAPRLATPPARAPARATEEPLLEGYLDDETGIALLLGIFAQELTGRLEISGGRAAGKLYFYKGEPVAADHAKGNGGLLAELERFNLVPENLDIRFVPEGELLATLVAAGNVTGEAMHRFVGGFVRARLLELIMQQEGTYRFLEDKHFLDRAPLLRVNPFGIMLERRRSSTLPPDLQAQHKDIAERFMTPRPALRLAAEKLRPFARGQRVDELVGSGLRVDQLLERLGLDELMGTLFVLTLVDGRLVELGAPPAVAPAPDPVVLGDSQRWPAAVGTVPEIVLLDEDDPSAPGTPPPDVADAELREEILNLYMRLKPLSHPRQVLGVPVWADRSEIEEAYKRRMAELDPRRVPEGPSREMLAARLEELRAKVMRAMEVLQFQGGGRPGAPLPSVTPPDDDDNKSNPF